MAKSKALVKGKVARKILSGQAIQSDRVERMHLIMDAIQLQLEVLRKTAKECEYTIRLQVVEDSLDIILR